MPVGGGGGGGGDFSLLHRTCKLVVLLCFLHISVTLVFYVKSLDIRFAFVPNSGSPHTSKPPSSSSNHVPPQNLNTTKDIKTQHHQSVLISSQGEEDTKKEEKSSAGEQQSVVVTTKPLEKCPENSPLLVGPLRVEFGFTLTLEQMARDNPRVEAGGRYRPADCLSRHKVALIIPFRNREEHLKYWLYYLHPILQRQQLDYGVYVINQDGDEIFNRAKLLNVGYQEALKDYDYDCFVFSDVDLIPMDDRNVYACFSQPRHLSVSMDKFGFRLPYNQYFGGVSSMSKEQFLKINGFPNNYWGWGGEDDDIYNRVVSRGMSISRPSGVVGKCRMIRHDRDKQNEPNPQRFDLISHTRDTMNRDGIRSLSYKVVTRDTQPLYTMVTVDIGQP